MEASRRDRGPSCRVGGLACGQYAWELARTLQRVHLAILAIAESADVKLAALFRANRPT